ncbi:MAG: hypothetical protein JO102_01335 [Elusimicrobia bacterium]|nr:hypothetical protein [Elusimicrobiota bacterium]
MTSNRLASTAAAALFLAAGAAWAASAPERPPVTGKATLKGAAAARRKIDTTVDPACAEIHREKLLSDDLIVSKSGGIKNVFVYVKTGVNGLFYQPGPPARLVQNGCEYAPHVQGVLVGQALNVINEDGTLHNVIASPSQNNPINFAQPVAGMKSVVRFRKPEIMVPFGCSVHPWMSAYVGVMENPFFAVTDDAGHFEIKGLPDGTFVLAAWHERLGTAEQTIVVKNGHAHPAPFVFNAK